MIRRLLNRFRRRKRPMTLEEYREYRDREWIERIRRIDQGPRQ